MKKIFALLLALSLLVSLAACGGANKPAADTTPSQTETPSEPKVDTVNTSLTDLMAMILADVPDLPGLGELELDAENFEWYAFAKYQDGVEALVSEALVNATPHSVVLVRMPEGSDVKAMADEIDQAKDPRKWICVEAEKSVVLQHGNLILLIMSWADTTEAITANFDGLFA